MKLIVPGTLVLVLATACAKSNDSSTGGSTATSGEMASCQQLAFEVQDGAKGYGATMMAAGMTTAADCELLHGAYDERVRPWVSQMVQMGASMDRYMDDHGGADVADYACSSAIMLCELDHYRAVACTSADTAANRTEAARHVNAMLTYGGHVADRCAQIARGIETGGWGYGPMMSGCETWEGHCGAAPQSNRRANPETVDAASRLALASR